MRRGAVITSTLALAVVLVGGFWPATSRDNGPDSVISTLRSTLGLETHAVAGREVISIPFGYAIPARHNDRQLLLSGQISCTDGEQFRVSASVIQGDTEGQGDTVDSCTGESKVFFVLVVVRGPQTFEPGEHARYEVRATTFSRGVETGEQTWEGSSRLEDSTISIDDVRSG